MEGGREREGKGAGGRGGRGWRRKAGGGGRREGGREGWGRGGRRKFYLRAELIKYIDPNEGEALKRGREGDGGEGGKGGGRREGGREGWGRGAAENFTWGAELIKCIDPNEGEALRRGSTFKPGVWRPLPPVPLPMGAGAGGREAGGRI